MKKAERDNLMRCISQEERQSFRRILQELRSEMKASSQQRITLSEALESRKGEFPPDLYLALQATVERDEMGPRVGEEPSDFCLNRLGTEERVRLSEFRGRRPVAIVFGSYT